MSERKTDYRTKKIRPTDRKTDCRKAIIDALTQGKKTFGNLLGETQMSRSTLAFHLKEMHKKGQVEREKDREDYRITHYSLTELGRGELRRQENIGALVSAKFLFPSPEEVEGLGRALFKLLEPSFRHLYLSLVDQDFMLLKDAVTYSIYSDTLLESKVSDYVNELAKLAASSMLSQLVLPLERKLVEKIPNISLVFELDTHIINKYLQHVEDETDEEHSPQLPDIRDFSQKHRQEG